MTKPMISPEFAAALQRVQEQRAKAEAEKKMLQPKRRLLRRSVLATNGLPDTSVHAISFLGRGHILGQKK